MGLLSGFVKSVDSYELISRLLPQETKASTPQQYVKEELRETKDTGKVLDLGCGDGNSMHLFNQALPDMKWHGVDIEGSGEVSKRVAAHKNLKCFDGVNLPYDDGSFELIYCNQVLEHVRFPDALVGDAFRVLKSGGVVVGSVSYLEPYHSRSIFNFTPFGLITVFEEAGFQLSEIRPGKDVLSLVLRQLIGGSRYLKFLWAVNYIHLFIALFRLVKLISKEEAVFLKVQFSGHLMFIASKP